MTYTVGEVTNQLHQGNNYLIKNGILQPTINIVSSISEIEQLPAAIFPIPARDFINIQSSVTKPITYQIYDMEGAVIMAGQLTDNTLSVSSLLPANYVLKLRTENQELTKKFIKL